MGTARGSGRSGRIRCAARCDGQRRSVAREYAGGDSAGTVDVVRPCMPARLAGELPKCEVHVTTVHSCVCALFVIYFCCTARLVLYST